MGEVPLHGVLLFLRLALDGIELDPLSLHVRQSRVLCTQCVNVGDDTCISEVKERVVDDKAVV
jgi:hypothetical protein